jgi:RNA polymerase sigma-70 factor (ECF subfamily)
MDRESFDQRLSQITTAWTVLALAHARPPEAGAGADGAAQARARLIQCYGAAVYRYLLGALRDPDAADELFQEFALRLVRGDFHRADPAKGRFRDFLKTALFRLIVDAQRRKRRRGPPSSDSTARDVADPAPVPGVADDEADRQFLAAWRAELLARAWDALADHERHTGQPLHCVLKLRADRPEMRSAEMAERLTERLGYPVNAPWVRKRLLRARATFTDALLDAVARSLAEPTREAIEQELIDLGLHAHCREALDRRPACPDPPG